jgi:hypothetical protein
MKHLHLRGFHSLKMSHFIFFMGSHFLHAHGGIHDMPITKCRIKAQGAWLYGNKGPIRWGLHSQKICPSGRYKMSNIAYKLIICLNYKGKKCERNKGRSKIALICPIIK